LAPGMPDVVVFNQPYVPPLRVLSLPLVPFTETRTTTATLFPISPPLNLPRSPHKRGRLCPVFPPKQFNTSSFPDYDPPLRRLRHDEPFRRPLNPWLFRTAGLSLKGYRPSPPMPSLFCRHDLGGQGPLPRQRRRLDVPPLSSRRKSPVPSRDRGRLSRFPLSQRRQS